MKRLIQRWLGLPELSRHVNEIELRTNKTLNNLTSLAADVSIYGESTIVVISRINGGYVKIINAKFSGLRDLREFLTMCERNYGARTNVIDAPRNDPGMRKHCRT